MTTIEIISLNFSSHLKRCMILKLTWKVGSALTCLVTVIMVMVMIMLMLIIMQNIPYILLSCQPSRFSHEIPVVLFDKSASVSEEEGFMHEKAIAYERAGLAVLHAMASTPKSPQTTSYYSTEATMDDLEYSHIANNYFSEAISSYRAWGAQTKVDQLLANGYGPK